MSAVALMCAVAANLTFAADGPQRWSVNKANSSLTFTTTKASAAGVGGVTEVMQFKQFEGGLDTRGRVQLKIDLTSIDSGISIRDERMQTMLWQVGQHPSVTFDGMIDQRVLPRAGQDPVVIELQGRLAMAGQSKAVTAQLQVTALSDKWLVSTR